MNDYQNIPTQAECPVCRCKDAHILWSVNSNQAAQHFILKEQYPEKHHRLVLHIEKLWGKNTSDVVQCDNCEFCYSFPYVAGDAKFYNLAYERTGYPKWKWEFQTTYDELNKLTDSDLVLLEIGAGNGAFVKRAAEIIPVKNISCTEFSEYGKQQIIGLGAKCYADDVRNLSSEAFKENFNVICMFQVLEHMDRLNVLFEKLNWLLKTDGSLFIAVPNQERIKFNETHGAYLDMPPNHIGRWNKKCFEEIGRLNGFRIEDYRNEDSSLLSRVKQFVIYKFLQNSQNGDSLANKIQRIENRYLQKIMQVIGVTLTAVSAIPAFTKTNFLVGNTQWVHFIKM